MACDTRGRIPEVAKLTAALKRRATKKTKEPGDNNAYHSPGGDVESSPTEYTHVEENDRKLYSRQSPYLYKVEAPHKLSLS